MRQIGAPPAVPDCRREDSPSAVPQPRRDDEPSTPADVLRREDEAPSASPAPPAGARTFNNFLRQGSCGPGWFLPSLTLPDRGLSPGLKPRPSEVGFL